ncbi:MAG: radical SAM protein [Rhodospirillaceae bacterium]|nr:radical SAM protein [Rhodospirillales bacterium]
MIAAVANPFSAAILTGGAAEVFRRRMAGAEFTDIACELTRLYPDHAGEILSDIRDVESYLLDSAPGGRPLGAEGGGGGDITAVIRFAREHGLFTNATVEVLTKCNLRCAHCFHPDHSGAGPDIGALETLFGNLRRSGALFLCLTGGEIFLRRDAAEIIDAAHSAGFIIELKTNGTRLDKKTIGRLARNRISDVQVSVYGVSDGANAFTGGHYDFTAVASAIEGLREAGVPCSVSYQLTPGNVTEMERAYEVLSRLTDNLFFSFYVTPRLGDPQGNALSRIGYDQLRDYVLPRLRAWGMAPDTPSPYRTKDCGYICWAGHEQAFFAVDGKVYPCPDLRIPIGDLSHAPAEEIVRNRFDALKRIMPTTLPACEGCSYFDFCDSCIGIALAENGTFHRPSPHKCDITRLQFEGGS